jgi:hypothetical protein
MIYRRTPQFKKAFKTLPENVQVKGLKAYQLFSSNPRHPSLGIKKIKGR